AGEELGLGHDRGTAPAGVAALPPSLALGLQSGGALHGRDFVLAASILIGGLPAATTPTAAPAPLAAGPLVVAAGLLSLRLVVGPLLRRVVALAALLLARLGFLPVALSGSLGDGFGV